MKDKNTKNIRMRIDEDSHHHHHHEQEERKKQEKNFSLKKEVKDNLKEKGVDLVVYQALGMANITMPLPMLSMMLDLFKTLEKQLTNQLEQGMER